MVVCRPSTLACTFYSLISLAASHSPSFPLPLFYLLHVSPSSSLLSFSTLTFFLFVLSLSLFLYSSFSSFHRFPLLSSTPLRPPQARQSFSLFLRAASLRPFLSRLPCIYICSPRGFQAIRAFLSHFHITRRSYRLARARCRFLKADLERS